MSHVRTQRPKTAAQRQKAADNISAYNERCRNIRERQQQANTIRKQYGLNGSDSKIIEQYDFLRAERYVKFVLSLGNVGRKIKRWLAGRIELDPITVESLIKNFLERDRNSEYRAYVNKCLEAHALVGRVVSHD